MGEGRGGAAKDHQAEQVVGRYRSSGAFMNEDMTQKIDLKHTK